MTDPRRWAVHGITVDPTHAWRADLGVIVRARSAVLGPEHSRSLAWWLLGHVGDRAAPADPDAVRVAIDEQRAALAARSAAAETSEDFRAGLAWADQALEAIAHAAEGNRP